MPLHIHRHHRIRLLDYLLMTLILCAFALQSWNVLRTTVSAVYELVLPTNQLDIPAAQHRSPRFLSIVQKVQRVTTPSINIRRTEPLSSSGTAGARSLNFHNGNVEAVHVVQTPRPSSGPGWTFEGMLSTDGSVSSVKLMMEGDQFAEYPIRPVNTSKSRRQFDNGDNGPAGKSSTPVHWQQDGTRQYAFDKKYPPCAETMRDLIPCSNSTGHLYGHCPNINRGPGSCAIPAPAFYARPFKWPESKNQVRRANVPNVPLLRNELQKQSWTISQVQGPRGSNTIIHFEDGDPRFPNGTTNYVHDLAMIIPDLNLGTNTRLVLDMGCGTGNVAAALEAQEVLTLCTAGEGSADNGVQLVLERGYPALVQFFGTRRLPYPSQAFDLIHCAACDVQWEKDAGLKLLEADRILRAGGFFVWMDPSKVEANWKEIEELTTRICWRTVARRGNIAIWQKPTNETCYLMDTLSAPPLCNASLSPDNSWNVPLQGCLGGYPGKGDTITYPWPIRLDTPPHRLEQAPAAGIEAAKAEAFKADLNYWMYIVGFYMKEFGPVRVNDIHNVLDMNAGYGGFAAAVSLKTLQWWVLNVVPVDQPDRLAVIFDRGLLGVYHDWCESLDVYPRTFDMVHASGLLSSTLKHGYLRCDMSDIVQEMDRVLRPGGFAVIRDQEDVLLQAQIIVTALHWKAQVKDTESGPKGKDKVLTCQKAFWRPKIGKNGKG